MRDAYGERKAANASGIGGIGEGSDSQEASRRLTSLWLLPLFQVPFVFVAMNVAFDELKGELPYVLTTFALIALCVAADALLFAQVSRSIEQRRTVAEAALLEERLAQYLDESSAMQDLLEDTARMRHDLRNHQAVVQVLCERGDVSEAAAYLAESSELLRAADVAVPATIAASAARGAATRKGGSTHE